MFEVFTIIPRAEPSRGIRVHQPEGHLVAIDGFTIARRGNSVKLEYRYLLRTGTAEEGYAFFLNHTEGIAFGEQEDGDFLRAVLQYYVSQPNEVVGLVTKIEATRGVMSNDPHFRTTLAARDLQQQLKQAVVAGSRQVV